MIDNLWPGECQRLKVKINSLQKIQGFMILMIEKEIMERNMCQNQRELLKLLTIKMTKK